MFVDIDANKVVDFERLVILSFNTLPCAADNGTFVVVVVRLFTTSLFFKQFTKLLFNALKNKVKHL